MDMKNAVATSDWGGIVYTSNVAIVLRALSPHVRTIAFPRDFSLLTGFPHTRIEDTNLLVHETLPEKQYIVYVA
jgi:hypothetical protein